MSDEPTRETKQAEPAPPKAAPRGAGAAKRPLGWGVAVLLTLATIAAILAFVSTWADRQVLSTNQWTETSTDLLASPAVREQLATYLVNQLFENVDVEAQLQQNLPAQISGLAGPISGELRQLATKAANTALAQPAVQQAWKNANRVAHQNLMVILEGGNEKISTANGVVTVNTKLLLTDIANQIGLPAKLVNKLPPQIGQLTVMRSDQLSSAQKATKAIKGMAVWFTLLTLVLYVAAIWLASGRRRAAVRWTGVSFASVGLLVLLLVGLAKSPVVDSLATTSAVVPAVNDVYDITTELLRQMATSMLVAGVLVVLASVLAGPAKFAVRFRREVAPYLREYLPASAVAASVLYLLVIWWAPTHGFRTVLGLFLNTLLAVSGFIALTVITRREFPDEPVPDFSQIGGWTEARWRSLRGFYGRQVDRFDQRDGSRGGAGGGDVNSELERLQSLRERGALTDEEFTARKRKLLDGD